jgi:hypothetical protein
LHGLSQCVFLLISPSKERFIFINPAKIAETATMIHTSYGAGGLSQSQCTAWVTRNR